MLKPKLSIADQVQYLADKGVQFNIITKAEAEKFLESNTYFFKIKAYLKNFPKNKSNRYVNLEFAYLKDLSTIDMRLRLQILTICLNIEHSLKVYLNTHLSSNNAENGYDIIKNFQANRPANLIYQGIKSYNTYTQNLIKKYDPDYALWNFIEVITFGDLSAFYNYYTQLYPISNNINIYLFPVRQLRNAAAHNSCLIHNFNGITVRPTLSLKVFLMTNGMSKDLVDRKMKIAIFHDFVALLYVFQQSVKSMDIKKHIYAELDNFCDRIDRNLNYYDKHLNIKNNLLFFRKIVDIFKKIEYTNGSEQKS